MAAPLSSSFEMLQSDWNAAHDALAACRICALMLSLDNTHTHSTLSVQISFANTSRHLEIICLAYISRRCKYYICWLAITFQLLFLQALGICLSLSLVLGTSDARRVVLKYHRGKSAIPCYSSPIARSAGCTGR